MNFNSAEFLLFFPIVLTAYFLLFRMDRWRDTLLLAASYFFYMTWNWRYAGLLVFATVFDYYIALWLERETRPEIRKRLIMLTVAVNLGLLGLFKYYNFFVDTAVQTAGLFGWIWRLPAHELLLPLGISFYTFETMSYTVDVYRRRIEAERSLRRYALYIAFWPHLVAGPIVRAADLLPQMRRLRPTVTAEKFHSGLLLVFQGLFKKIVVADLLAGFAVDRIFASPASFSTPDLLLALYGYAFQIYNDFSGYTDIAIGAARMLGYEILPNFNRPYLAKDVRDFWARWHISLSSWLRDYLYIELGGNRGGKWQTYRNLLLTMLLGGFWHGASWNFVLWGGFHGIWLVISHSRGKAAEAVGWVLLRKRIVTFHLVLASWLLFRVHDMGQLWTFVKGVTAMKGGSAIQPGFFAILFLAALLHFLPKPPVTRWLGYFLRMPKLVQAGAYAAATALFCALTMGSPAFIYFQF